MALAKVERELRQRLDALGPAPRAELLHVLMLPDLERADRIGEFWGTSHWLQRPITLSDTGGMSVIPPWGREEGLQWRRAHPWLMGFYSGMAAAGVAAVTAILGGSTPEQVLAVYVVTGLLAWPLMTLTFVRRWGERPEAEARAAMAARRPYSQASDRGLIFSIWFVGLVQIPAVYSLVAGKGNAVVTIVVIGGGVWLVVSSWKELERRKRERETGQR